jgi:hypothetical protein
MLFTRRWPDEDLSKRGSIDSLQLKIGDGLVNALGEPRKMARWHLGEQMGTSEVKSPAAQVPPPDDS